MVVIQDEANIFNDMFSLIEKSNDEDEVTLLNINRNLNTLFVRRLKKLDNILIDSVIELTTENDSMNCSLDGLNEENRAIVVQMSVL